MAISLTETQVWKRSQRSIAGKLLRQIGSWDGSARQARDILRGLAAAKMLNMNLRRFEDALAKRVGRLDAA
jgi:hypothetical protein